LSAPHKALITGGSGGIGAAVTERLARAGMEVCFTHLGQEAAAAELADRLAADGLQVRGVESDVADPDAVDALLDEFPAAVVVHCAGVARDRMIWKQPLEDFHAVMSVNLRGAWLLMRAAAPAMRAAGWGRVVLIGSINGSRGKAGQTLYAASKAGLVGMARSAAKELGRRGVTVNVVEPGWIDTPMTLAVPAEHRDAALAESLTGSLGTPDDVAAAVEYLCSATARQVTGQVLRVDGGQLLS
jgi:NAD(P)-dependent dehydrogenase (short-subunit alcohol dehydrogenase family)